MTAPETPSQIAQDLEERRITCNGIELRVFLKGTGPLIVLVHGWPELWYSWRHQIDALAAAGYRVAVPDVRGYGGSDKPQPVAAYRMSEICADIADLIAVLGREQGDTQAVVIGHDWGAPIAWHTALLHPDKVRAVGGLSVPYTGRSPAPPLDLWAEIYKGRFFYQLYFQKEGPAESELEADLHRSLRVIYYSACADGMKAMMADPPNKGPDDGMLDGMPDPDPFPAWLSAAELDYYAGQFQAGGMRGPLNRYRCQNMDWEELAHLEGVRIAQPCLFVAGALDPVLAFVPDIDMVQRMREQHTEDLRTAAIIEDGGHWIQQEKPAEVNRLLREFLHQLDGDLA